MSDAGDIEAAINAYNNAIRLDPQDAKAYLGLGLILRSEGKYREALPALIRGHQLGSVRRDWSIPSEQWVEECRRKVELLDRLEAVTTGEAMARDVSELFDLVKFAYDEARYVTATQLLAGLLDVTEDESGAIHYNAASCAVLAALGEGVEGALLDADEKITWRRQAFTWLHDATESLSEQLASSPAEGRAEIVEALRFWQDDLNLASVRDPEEVTALPD